MTRPHRSPAGPRRGFSLLEVQAAFVVLGLSMAALFPFAIAQLKLVAALERRLPPNATYVLISKDHEMVSLLVAGAGPSTAGTTGHSTANTSTPATRTITIDQVQPTGTGPMDMTATVTVTRPSQSSGGN